jgi:hypothetical protein
MYGPRPNLDFLRRRHVGPNRHHPLVDGGDVLLQHLQRAFDLADDVRRVVRLLQYLCLLSVAVPYVAF